MSSLVSRLNKWVCDASPLCWVPVLLATGGVLRLTGMTSSYLWYDEAFSLAMTRLGFIEMLQALKINISPPAWEVLLWFLTRLFGRNEFAARLPSLLASLGILYVVFLLTREFKLSPGQQALSLAGVALLPYQLWIAQDGKLYAAFTLLFLVGVLWACQARWVGLAGVAGLMLWSHNVAVLYLPGLWLLALIRHPKSWRAATLACVAGFISWLPWVRILLRQAGVDIPWFVPLSRELLVDSFMIALYAWTLPVFGYAFALFLLLTRLVYGILERPIDWILYRMRADLKLGRNLVGEAWRRLRARYRPGKPAWDAEDSRWHLAVLILVSLLLFILVGLFVQNVLLYRTISPLTIPLVMWLATFLGRPQPNLVRRGLLLGWACTLLVALLHWSPADKSGNFPQMLEIVRSHYQPGDVIYHSSGTTVLLFWHYLPKAKHYLLDDEVIAQMDVAIARIDIPKAALEQVPHRRAWVIWSRTPVQREVNGRVNNRMRQYVEGCRLVGKIHYQQIWPALVYLCGG
ncbi:MAG: glycosyltransferase family 39 protein [Anaerolineales bacterium]|nr:glycosyltransferase family 39 protein [Anaerolineales bacterium]